MRDRDANNKNVTTELMGHGMDAGCDMTVGRGCDRLVGLSARAEYDSPARTSARLGFGHFAAAPLSNDVLHCFL